MDVTCFRNRKYLTNADYLGIWWKEGRYGSFGDRIYPTGEPDGLKHIVGPAEFVAFPIPPRGGRLGHL